MAQVGTNRYTATIGESRHSVTLLNAGSVQIDQQKYSFDLVRTGVQSHSLLLDGSVFEVFTLETVEDGGDKSFQFSINGHRYKVTIEDHKSAVRKTLMQTPSLTKGTEHVKAPMPGKVVRLEVSAGESVVPGKGLLVLEAMKMENEIKSTTSGQIEQLHVEIGKAVEKGEILVSIRPV